MLSGGYRLIHGSLKGAGVDGSVLWLVQAEQLGEKLPVPIVLAAVFGAETAVSPPQSR